jgi:hypothetical protein
MRHAVVPAALGILLLVGAAVVPVADFLTAEYDSDYVYEVGSSGYCGGLVATSSPEAGTGGHTYDLSELSVRGRRHVRHALANGSHRVEREQDTAPAFTFADDHFAANKGCYVVHHDGTASTLTTRVVSHRTDLEDRRLAKQVGPVLLYAGVAGLVAAAALALARSVGVARGDE